jgi:hypothetical protein
MSRTKKLTAEMAIALLLVRDGADVYSRFLAGQLREVERVFPQFVSIGAAQMPHTDVKRESPFFGAIATPAGIAQAERVGMWGCWAASKLRGAK